MADWPVTVNEYAAGSLCNSSEYKADFEKLRNAVNSLHARYSTLCLTASLTEDNIANGTLDFHALTSNTDEDRRVLALFKVPTWAQAFRVRQFDVLNSSALHGTGTASLTGSDLFQIGVSHGDALHDFDAHVDTAGGGTVWSATTIKMFSGTEPTKADMTDAFLTGYDADTEDPAFLTDGGLSAVVTGGNYIAIWAAGGFTLGATGSNLKNIKFEMTVWLDAMVPIP